MKKILTYFLIMSFLLAFVSVAKAEEAKVDQFNYKQNLVKYIDGILYVYHYSEAPPVTISFDPGLKIEGQLLTTTDQLVSNSISAKFVPVQNNNPITLNVPGSSNFQVLLVSAREGEGKIKVVVGSETKEFQAVPASKTEIEWPQCELFLLEGYKGSKLPWKIKTDGNVVFSSQGIRKTEEIIDGRKVVQAEAFSVSTSDGSKWFNGTAVLIAEFPYIGWQFPFCPVSTLRWISEIEPAPVKIVQSAQYEPPQEGKKISIAAPALAVMLLFLILLLVRRRKKKEEEEEEGESSTGNSEG